MAETHLGPVLRHLRRLAVAQATQDLSDRQLLHRFSGGRDQAAFVALVQRHAAVVWGVCRNVLGHEHDTEDAFQATFLVLARRADSIRRTEALSAWLHGVAYRVAMTAKRKAAVRRSHERQQQTMAPPQAPSEAALRDLRAVLDEEIQRLPQKYRAPFVLCCLESKSKPEAAQELGWKEATVSWRLAQARKLLQARLTRRGVTLSAVLGAVALAQRLTPAILADMIARVVQAVPVPGTRAAAGVVAAGVADLVTCVTKAMKFARVKFALALMVVLGLAMTGACLVAHQVLAPRQPDGPPPTPREAKSRPDASKPARTDRYGDALPPGCIGRLGTVRFRHNNWIHALVRAPDGRTLATAAGNTISIWDDTGKLRRRFDGQADEVQCLAFSPDGRRLASGGSDNLIHLWDPITAKEIRRLAGHQANAKQPFLHEAGVSGLIFSRDGKRLYSLGTDKTIRQWNVDAGKEIGQFKGFQGDPRNIVLSGDGKVMAAAAGQSDQPGEVMLWEAATGRQLHRLRHPAEVWSITFSPDSKTLAAGSGALRKPGELQLWDVASGKRVRSWQGHQGWVFTLAFTPDGRRLVSGGYDKTIRLWETATGKELRVLGRYRSPVYSLAMDRDGRTLLYRLADNTVHFQDLVTGKEQRQFEGHENWVPAIAVSPDGKYLASGSQNGAIRLWDVPARQEIRRLQGQNGNVTGLRFGADGKTLVSAGADGTIRLWQVPGGKEIRRINAHRGWVTCLALAADGRMAASFGDNEPIIRLWETATGKEVRQIRPPKGFLYGLAFSPDGKLLASAGGIDEYVRLWDVATAQEIRALKHEGGIKCLAFSPDGKTLAVGCMDHTVSLWEMATGRKRLWLRLRKNVTSIAFAPGGQFLATGNFGNSRIRNKDNKVIDVGNEDKDKVRLWDLATGKELPRLAGHQGGITALAFAANGKWLASASVDTTILLWDTTGLGRNRQPPALAARQLEKLWADLAGDDAPTAYRAIGTLAEAPSVTMPYLAKHLRPVVAADPKRVASLLARLDSRRFSERRQAMHDLEQMGDTAEPALRAALDGNYSVEVRQRIKRLLGKLATGPRLRAGRALEALERIGPPQARPLLERLAGGARLAWLTKQAQAALGRLARR